jgi:hypothetical protein
VGGRTTGRQRQCRGWRASWHWWEPRAGDGGDGRRPGRLSDGRRSRLKRKTAASSSWRPGKPSKGVIEACVVEGMLGEVERARVRGRVQRSSVKQPHGDGSRTAAAHLPEDSGGALAQTGRRLGTDSGVVGFRHGRWCGRDGCAVGTRRGEAASAARGVFGQWPVGRLLIPHVRVRTAPPMATNQGAVRGDTATDRWAPHISVFLN